MEKVYVLQHIEIETLGIIADCLASARLTPRYIKTFAGRPVPKEMGEASGLIIMGGPMGVYEAERFPFISDELRLVEDALKKNRPVLGICLGSQLIAAALGAKVYRAGKKEIGWHDVFLESAAFQDPLLKGTAPSFTAYHWHGDIFDLPRGAVSLARSVLTACQGFRYGGNVYGFMFHMEVTGRIIHAMADCFKEEMDQEDLDGQVIVKGIQTYLPRLQSVGTEVFKQWVNLATPGSLFNASTPI